MNILITGHHLDLTPAIRLYVQDKLQPITRHLDIILEIEVILGLEAPAEKELRQRAEVNLRLKGETLHAEHRAEDLYAAIDGVMEKIDRQALKTKGKIKEHRRESPKRQEEPATEEEGED
ncbi:MAG TPA: ribosome-associated translation inhibitor RaiA [Oxalicibacterium sp.]|jgi:putative sigma-54 modulation protein|nr:ribosome-associated translation inhibitor RaiA [Oxalicibacterium sp.]